ncbi:winged helix-turn-helix transcriptional regulator [Streptomyces sp. PKU-EA00015]|uniref:ArsR/SmtB family transcription factor n=1 Tax=Streptomyces sp. PKU-EA00015 TaxID=2748326 RepID=UPI0015A472F7|nr:winged helix-turn-helix domain-containing protein [Streptomyces sp. PKU-EA00015]NWF27376.1 winged helix-turn-helix transcriptional regulator [Streptomyces sp. PKU-EA00015]
MGWWEVDADTLASSRFVVSPLCETTASLMVLEKESPGHPAESRWLDSHRSAYRERLAADPVTAVLVPVALGRHRWIADFLTPVPSRAGEARGGAEFHDELARIRETPADTARTDLEKAHRGPLPGPLLRPDLPERIADLLEWVWRETVAPDWPRRRRVIEADVVARAGQLSRAGWAAALDDMHPQMRWLGDSRLQINTRAFPPRQLRGSQLLLVPVTPRRGWISMDRPDSHGAVHRNAVVYPCSGTLAEPERAAAPKALGRLLGAGRARVLVFLDSPMSTTHLVAVTGQGLGSVGRHLKVLLDAGLVGRRRAGRSVLYYRTAAGDVLVRAQDC